MITNNFDQIKEYILNACPPSEEDFYFCQIMQRKKDFDEAECPFTGNNRILKSYIITRPDWFDFKRDEIIRFCDNNNARAVINLNPKSMKNLCKGMLKQLAQLVCDDNYGACLNVETSVAGKLKSSKKEFTSWLLDVDDCSIDDDICKEILDYIDQMQPMGTKLKMFVKSNAGVHIIASSFNSKDFNKKFPKEKVSIHKNNPTLLYSNVLK